MKRLLLVILVAAMIVLAGCTDGTGTDNGEPTVETDDDIEDVDRTELKTILQPRGDETDLEETNETEDDEPDSGDDPDVDGELEIHHIDVGYADATLLIEPSGETMLIDSGDWPQAGVDVLNPPEGDSRSDLHDNSVALSIEFDKFSYLTTGDSEAAAEQRMVDEHGDQLEANAY
ncbi:ComEC/Rec2 family competence protein [Natronorubrum thiooxidans]